MSDPFADGRKAMDSVKQKIDEAIKAHVRAEVERLTNEIRAGISHGAMMCRIYEARDPFFPREQREDDDAE